MTDTPGSPNQLFTYEHDASRLELLIRIIYWILIGIVLWIYGIIAFICLFVQWFHIMTDKRPEIFPVPVKIYKE